MKNRPLKIGNTSIQPGERVTLGLPTPEMSSYISMHVPIHVIHGKKEGPCLLISGALHGDEMNGISIIHKLLSNKKLNSLSGTLIAIPTINVYGLMTLTRNLPDRRDLEGSFPGSERGSFAGRLAHYFTEEVFSLATHCIDIHTADAHQFSIPQIVTDLDNPVAYFMADAFQPTVVKHELSDRGLLWQNKRGIPTIIYEAGEPLRMDERSIRTGYHGIMRVMQRLNMLKMTTRSIYKPVVVRNSRTFSSPTSGVCQFSKKIGAFVEKGDKVANIYDPFGTAREFEVLSEETGIIITQNRLPIINEGDPLLELALTQHSVSDEEWHDE